jgi:hypothetical protein
MVSYTQNELSSIWQRLKDGTEFVIDTMHDEQASIRFDGELEQTLEFSTVAPYSDSNNDSTTVSYTRRKHSNKEATWREWVRKN